MYYVPTTNALGPSAANRMPFSPLPARQAAPGDLQRANSEEALPEKEGYKMPKSAGKTEPGGLSVPHQPLSQPPVASNGPWGRGSGWPNYGPMQGSPSASEEPSAKLAPSPGDSVQLTRPAETKLKSETGNPPQKNSTDVKNDAKQDAGKNGEMPKPQSEKKQSAEPTHPLKPDAPKDGKPEPNQSQHGNASKLVGIFKVTFSLLVTGGINAFLFGVPLPVAAGASALVAASQSAVALKIHREDHPLSRKLVAFTRRLTGKTDDKTPSGKEWAMVPIWGAVCGFFGLAESVVNHAVKSIREKNGIKPKDFDTRLKAIEEDLGKPNCRLRRIKELQRDSMNLGKTAFAKLSEFLEKWAKKESLIGKPGQLANWAFNQFKSAGGGRKMGLAYTWGFVITTIGGMAQTSLAALLQQRIDKAHGLKR